VKRVIFVTLLWSEIMTR